MWRRHHSNPTHRLICAQALVRLKDRKASCKDADSVLLPLDVPPKGLDALVNGLAQTTNCDGLIVTRPHKESILKSCTHLTAAARAVGCCNVVRFHKGSLIGTNMDGDGFVGGLIQQRGANAVRNQRCLLVGAGGAARAVAHGLVQNGARSVSVVNRTKARAQALAARIPGVRALDALPASLNDVDLLIQCTSLGHEASDPDPVPRDLLRPPLVCCEVVHTPEETAFLRAARERGCDTHAGTHMLSAQLDAICEFLVARPEDWPDAWAFSSTSRVAEVS
jgi:shikimate dehydrogenase